MSEERVGTVGGKALMALVLIMNEEDAEEVVEVERVEVY